MATAARVPTGQSGRAVSFNSPSYAQPSRWSTAMTTAIHASACRASICEITES
jgi:hypothetical protein